MEENETRYVDVKKIIDEWDPFSLWRFMCPPDEYHTEITEIRTMAKECKDAALLGKFILKYLSELSNEEQTFRWCQDSFANMFASQ